MKQRFYLFKRRGVYYIQDAETGEQKSLRIKDKQAAQQILQAKIQSSQQPSLNLSMARVYLNACDAKLLERTWGHVMDEFCKIGRSSSQQRKRREIQSNAFQLIRNRKLIETTTDDLKAVMNAGGVFTNQFLRCLHNLALGLGWLPWPIIPPKLWPKVDCKPKRGITWDEHQKIVQTERNEERKRFYELLWEVGASQSDAAALTSENIDWKEKTLTYQRKKTGETAVINIGARLGLILKQLPQKGTLFTRVSTMLEKDRSAEFRRRCRILKIEGVSLHSYRYAWAERAKTLGYPERFAQAALGHNSVAVHRAYARKAQVKIPSLEEYEKTEQKIVSVEFGTKEEDPLTSENIQSGLKGS